ncbi:MAG: GNAT family N-acetyltransferase [Bacteroidia bacterium]
MEEVLKLRVIEQKEDKSKHEYASDDCQLLLKMYDDFYPKIGFNIPWVGYFVTRDEQIIGSCGFVGAPRDGSVELAYWTFKEFEGLGVASFACKELIEIANRAHPGITLEAKTEPRHNASTRILEKNKFVFTKIVQDTEIGDAWFWVRKAESEE